MPAREGDLYRERLPQAADHKRSAFFSLGFQIDRAYARALAEAEANFFPWEGKSDPGSFGIIGVVHRHGLLAHSPEQLSLGLGDGRQRMEMLEVHRVDVEQNSHVGIRDRREAGKLAGVAHSHLEHRRLVFGLDSQQAER